MEKEKKTRFILIALIVLLTTGIITFLLLKVMNKEPDVPEGPNAGPSTPNIPEEPKYIESVNQGIVENDLIDYKHKYIYTYDEYIDFIEKYNLETKISKESYEQNAYLVLVIKIDECSEGIEGIVSADFVDNKMKVIVGVERTCGVCAAVNQILLLPKNKEDISPNQVVDYEIEYDYQYVNEAECEVDIDKKPIIYLYPEEVMEVSVKLKYPGNLTTTYPKYKNGWNVLAHPNGELIDLETNRSFYGLYWEGFNTVSGGIQEEGFVVKGEDSARFLEEKLALLGLNEREANEFIIYWLPILEANVYNYIRFETMAEINENMPLEINPKPDTIIRVLMEFKGLDKPIYVKEQKLTSPNRYGFTVVEWGGTELN